MAQQPNIILIFTDQWRGDCLSVTGHPVVETSTLDMVAHWGTVFTRAYAACPSCVAARACLMTGQTPTTLGRLGYRDCVPWRYPVTLAGELARGGYQTHCVGKTHFYPQRIHLGFHSIENYECLQNHDGDFKNHYYNWLEEQPGGPWDENAHGLDSNSWVARPSTLPEHLHVNSWTVTRSLDFIRHRDPTRPFFLKVSFHRPHPPIDPPAEYFHMYDNVKVPPFPVGDWASGWDQPVDNVAASTGRIQLKQMERARRAYWGQITHIDTQINRLIVHLQRNGLMQNTILLFTSDHGELLGDHFMFRKQHSLEGSAKLPFIVSAPSRFGLKRGHTSDAPITHMDIMPTLLELAGLPIPDSVEGRSLVPLLRGEAPADWREYVHGEHAMEGHRDGGPQFLCGRRYKYTWYTRSGRELLFDIASDPDEMVNLATKPQHAGLLDEWRGKLVAELAQRPQDGLTDGKRLIAGKALPAVRPELLEPYYDNEGMPRPARKVSRFED